MSSTQKMDSAAAPMDVKLLLIGNPSVGKTSLLLRFSDQQWLPQHGSSTTIGVDFRRRIMDIHGKKIRVNIWDTAGMERFRTVISSYYRGAQGIILVYDVTSRESFGALPKWFADFEPYVPSTVVKIIVGNKVDKEDLRQVPASEGQAFATRMNALFVEASAATAVGVQEVFRNVVERIVDPQAELRQSADARTDTNVIATSLIGYMAWEHQKIMRQCLDESSDRRTRNSSTMRALALLFESGLAYSIILVIAMIAIVLSHSKLAHTPNVAAFLSSTNLLFTGCFVMILAIYPTIIIFVVALNRSPIEGGFVNASIGSGSAALLPSIVFGGTSSSGSAMSD